MFQGYSGGVAGVRPAGTSKLGKGSCKKVPQLMARPFIKENILFFLIFED